MTDTSDTEIKTGTTVRRNPKTTKATAKAATETARDKFLRLAPPRMEATLKKISLLGNLAGYGYDYQPGEAEQIVRALQDAIAEVERKFGKVKTSKQGFSFRRKP
jgi:hypothetical protein